MGEWNGCDGGPDTKAAVRGGPLREVRTEILVAERRHSATTDGIDAARCENRRCATAVLRLRATA